MPHKTSMELLIISSSHECAIFEAVTHKCAALGGSLVHRGLPASLSMSRHVYSATDLNISFNGPDVCLSVSR